MPRLGDLLSWAVLPVLFLLFSIGCPVTTFAQNVGDLSPNPLGTNSIGNPFTSGGPWSPVAPRSQGSGRASPSSPSSWSNVSPVLPSTPLRTLDNEGRLSDVAPLPRRQPGPSRGPYGITLPPDHPLDVR
jgi:hypothetical protein